jgi:hypothetical protein
MSREFQLLITQFCTAHVSVPPHNSNVGWQTDVTTDNWRVPIQDLCFKEAEDISTACGVRVCALGATEFWGSRLKYPRFEVFWYSPSSCPTSEWQQQFSTHYRLEHQDDKVRWLNAAGVYNHPNIGLAHQQSCLDILQRSIPSQGSLVASSAHALISALLHEMQIQDLPLPEELKHVVAARWKSRIDNATTWSSNPNKVG